MSSEVIEGGRLLRPGARIQRHWEIFSSSNPEGNKEISLFVNPSQPEKSRLFILEVVPKRFMMWSIWIEEN